ncbi:hypothetical protein CORC01_05725 [Colletotrichum orchidophilum]|uniref:Uncharacterized protein n=1 Tax=Colletotrichum orchidophilum TaxID=1209926 RepID=A0A1G4BCH4_9PEZI|nr:uncharacterized protein CORC01_05725 [Colletotrichum orchidophilum]OHE99035.1 hypothetical protein CORC01_05725 [Colletotrichum orchidophilum]
MFPRLQPCRRKSVLSILLLFFLALLVDRASATPSPSLTPAANTGVQDLSHLAIDPDASCDGYEGQWNCLSDTFQHCANGTWSDVLSCTGTSSSADEAAEPSSSSSICTPIGRTDIVDFDGECNAAWAWGNGGNSGWGGGGTSCNGNRCYYGAGERLEVSRWVWSFVGMVFVLGAL